MTRVDCEGWWEQIGYGRQPMEQLQLSFEDGQVTGAGIDIVGPFQFHGRLEAEGGNVALIKQYLGQHRVDYVGEFDGEGTLHGTWHLGPWDGNWLIKIVSQAETSAGQDQTARFYGEDDEEPASGD